MSEKKDRMHILATQVHGGNERVLEWENKKKEGAAFEQRADEHMLNTQAIGRETVGEPSVAATKFDEDLHLFAATWQNKQLLCALRSLSREDKQLLRLRSCLFVTKKIKTTEQIPREARWEKGARAEETSTRLRGANKWKC